MRPYGLRALTVMAVVVLGGIIAAGGFWLLARVGDILLLFAGGGLLAFVLMPAVDFLTERRLPRVAAIMLVYLGLMLAFAGLGALFLPSLIEQTTELAPSLPELTQRLQQASGTFSAWLEPTGLRLELSQVLQGLSKEIQAGGEVLLSQLIGLARGISLGLVNAILVLVIGFYFLHDGHGMSRRLIELTPAEHRPRLRIVMAEAGAMTGRYVRSRLFLALLVGVLSGAASGLIGLRFAAVIGVLAALFELIPFLGPWLGAVPALTIALIQGPPVRLLAVAIAFAIIQLLEGEILAPRVTGQAVGLHPLAVIFVVLAGAQVWGVWGALLAAPTVGLVVSLAQAVRLKGYRLPAVFRRAA